VPEVFIVMAGKHHGQEWGELEWTLDNVVAKSHTEILESAVIVAIVNRKLMGKGPVVFAKPIGHAHVDGKLVANAIVEFLDCAEGTNVPIVMTRPVSVIVVSVEQVLIADRGLALPFRGNPGLAEAGGVGEQNYTQE
jgi:hypothetical protein